MMVVQLFGLKPAGHHFINILFHAANSVLLFLVLKKMTGAQWRSAFVAGLFALHPLRVESVAWVAERKDVLCGFFWLLTIWFYASYVQRKTLVAQFSAIGCFILALLSKPMAVTLPCALLLLDIWPLKRWNPFNRQFEMDLETIQKSEINGKVAVLPAHSGDERSNIFFAQKSGGAVIALSSLSLHDRFTNALVSYASYIRKMFWPSDLSLFYPHPPRGADLADGTNRAGGSGPRCHHPVVVLLATMARRRSYFAVEFGLWFLGTLFPGDRIFPGRPASDG